MHKKSFALLAAIGVFGVGCGGGGSNAPQVANMYAGNYRGSFIDQSGNTGQFQLTVNSAGRVNGQYFYNWTSISTVTGSIDKDGHGRMNFGNGPATIQFNNNPEQTSTIYVQPASSTLPKAIVVLEPSPTGMNGSNNPFTGNYAATLKDTTLNQSVALAVSISPTGAVTGTEISLNKGDFSTTTIVGSITPAGVINLPLAQQVTVTGTLSIAAIVGGPVQLSNGDSGNLSMFLYGGSFGPPPPAK